jgi:hypothetical protein
MSQDWKDEVEEGLEEENKGGLKLPASPKTDTQKYLEDLINQVESQIPSNVNYMTGIIVDDDRNLIIIKNGKLYIGKDENNALEIREYAETNNPTFVINGLYILKEMIPSYKDFWSGELEKRAKKSMWDVM